jgi:hypothetical protein
MAEHDTAAVSEGVDDRRAALDRPDSSEKLVGIRLALPSSRSATALAQIISEGRLHSRP